MNTPRAHKRPALLAFALLLLSLSLAGFLWVHKEQHQYAFDRQLIAALVRDDSEQALALVEAGADPNTRCDPPRTTTFFRLMDRLLRRTPPPINDSPTAFMFACGAGYKRMSGSNPRHPSLLKHPRLLSVMLAHGANVNAQSRYHWTALEGAIFKGKPRVVELLLHHGAQVNPQRESSQPILAMAITCSPDPAIIQLLLRYGADVNAWDAGGQTPLMEAVEQDAYAGTNIGGLLLAYRVNVNAGDNSSRTALHVAVMNGADQEITRQLLQHGADPTRRDTFGRTPLWYAQKVGASDIVALLRNYSKHP